MEGDFELLDGPEDVIRARGPVYSTALLRL